MIKGENKKEESQLGRIWIHMMAGATAGVVSRSITNPLERLKTMAQFHGRGIRPTDGYRMMVQEGGFLSMWRGNGANLIKVVPEITFKFVFFNEVVKFITPEPPASFGRTLLAGAITGSIIQTTIHPIDVLKTKLVLRKTTESSNIIDQIKKGYAMHGRKFAYLGFLPALTGKTIFTAIDFTVYQACKKIIQSDPEKMDQWKIMICGLCSSFVSLLATYPFGVLSTYRQASGKNDYLTYKQLLQMRGPLGMYRGVSNAIWKIVPSYAIAYVCYETVLQNFNHSMAI